MSKSRETHYSHVANGVEHFLVGPMPARDFLSAFFSERPVSPSSFKDDDIFGEVVETLHQKNRAERSMYKPFCSAVAPYVPNLVVCDTSSQLDTAVTKYAFSIKPDCVVYSKENADVIGTDSSVVDFFIEFKYSSH